MDSFKFLSIMGIKLSSKQKLLLNSLLEQASTDQFNTLIAMNYKHPIIGVVLGFFLGHFGIDRFYQGKILLGSIKLLFLIIGSIFLFFGFGILLLWILQIWVFIDYFLVFFGIQKDNYEKILKVLAKN